MRKKVFITGGRGRLAGLIKQYLDPAKYEVKLFSRQTGQGYENVNLLHDSDYLRQADYLLHLAWGNYPSNSEKYRQDWIKSEDCLELMALLRSCQESGKTKFVFFSSGAIYGNTYGVEPLTETHPFLIPPSWYGQSKIFAEKMIRKYPLHLILRITNPYGMNLTNESQGVIPKIVEAALFGKPLKVWGKGKSRKDFLYYTDFINALDHILFFNLLGTYNLCQGETNSIEEVIKMVEIITDKDIKIEHVNEPSSWDVTNNLISNFKIKTQAAWTPQIKIEQGLINCVKGAL
jgi:nucleoside-diphosphate-sugar epimerase